MRKQFLIIVSVAVVSFLLGTLVSMGLTATGIMPNLFENPASEIQMIRFTQTDEINVTTYSSRDPLRTVTASFTWNPKNPQSNMILSIYCYFEVRWEAWTGGGTPDLQLYTRIYVNGSFHAYGIYGYESNVYRMETLVGNASDWTLVAFQVNEFSHAEKPNLTPSWVRPNQESYNITMVVGTPSLVFWTPTYVRNINIIMEVIDG